MNLGGIPVQVIDTAGIRPAAACSDAVEVLGVERARQMLLSADALLLLIDAEAGLTPALRALYAELADRAQILLVLNKRDPGACPIGKYRNRTVLHDRISCSYRWRFSDSTWKYPHGNRNREIAPKVHHVAHIP